MPTWLTFDFSPAVVKAPFGGSQPSAWTPTGSGLRVGWLLPNLDVNTASTRYRCFHFARVLARWGVEQSFYTDPEVASASLEQIDTLIIVKRVEPDLIALVAAANDRNRPVFLDLCDDLLHERHPRNVGGVHRMVFNGIAPLLAGVVTPTSTMAQRVRGYAGSVELPIHVIPDIAETEDLFYETAEFVTGKPQARSTAPGPRSNKARKSVVWFGASGGIHSNFGIASLLPAMPALRAVNQQIPIELVLVSNKEAAADAVIRPFAVPTRYEPWSPETVYAELSRADAALLTTGDDDFSITKSANRLLQALSAGVPVVMADAAGQAVSDTDVAAFSDCMQTGASKGLLAYLGPEGEKNVAAAMTGAKKLIARYDAHKLTQLWLDLLVRQVAERRTKSLSQSKGRSVLVLENGDSLQDLEAVVAACRQQRRQLELVVSLATVAAQPQLLEICARHQLVPTVVKDPKSACPHRLYGVERFVVEDERGEVARTVKQWLTPRHLAVHICSLARFRQQLDESAAEPFDPPVPVVDDGADPELFLGHERGDGVVGLSCSYDERQNPDRLLELMQLLPHRRFHLIGRKWEQYALFGAMQALPNFSYLTIPNQQHPEQYRKFDVFLSMSTLESGPVPLLKAMMCNAVPVASNTGAATALIRHGENGFLFDVDAPASTIAWQIEAALQLECDVRSTVLPRDGHDSSKTAGLGE